MSFRSLSTSMLLFLAACAAVGPDYEAPQRALPATWRAERAGGLAEGAPVEGAFWKALHDPVLDHLVTTALAQNLDLKVAFSRLLSARALRGVAAADFGPQVDARASYEHREESRNTPFGAFIPRTNIHSIGADASWELDLWGRVRRQVEAAQAEIDASVADVRGAALTVATEVVATYVDLRAAQQRLAIAKANLALQEQTLGLVRARAEAGLVVERDVAQAGTNVESTRSRLPTLQAAEQVAKNRLAVLLGKAPGELDDALLAAAPLPVLPVSVAVGLPADLLRRRPDVQAAEQRLHAEIARIGATEAERYPRFSLGGSLGLAANSANMVFDRDSDSSAFGPSLRWNLFDGGRLRQRVQALEANAEAAQITWEQTVLLALEEAENAMTRFVQEQARLAALRRAASEAARAVQLAQSQYATGLSDFQSVIDSERTVATIQDDLVASEAAVAGSLVAIWKALGGDLVPSQPDGTPSAGAPVARAGE